MTLILTCLTEEYIVQVSDRRLTQADRTGAAIKIVDDASNKALFLNYMWLIGFTGLATLQGGRERADLWLAERLAKSEGLALNIRLQQIADALPNAVRWATPKDRRLAFVGGGYAKVNGGPVRPSTFTVSNFLDADYRPTAVSPDFRVQIRQLENRRDFVVMSAGAGLFENHSKQLQRTIRSARKRAAGPIEVARILADAVLKVAKYNKGVGDRLMICSLPRTSVERTVVTGGGFVSGGLSMTADEASFFYLGPETADLKQFGPTVVAPGMITSDMYLSFGNDEKPATPPPDILKIHYQGPNGTKTPDDAQCPCGSGKPYKGCHNQAPAVTK